MSKTRKADQDKASVKIADLMTKEFQVALATFMNSELPVKVSFLALQVFDRVVEHQKHFEDIRMKILTKYVQRDDKGALMMNESRDQYVLSDKAAFDSEYGELMDIEVDVPMIPLSSIGDTRLSPAMLRALVKTVVSAES